MIVTFKKNDSYNPRRLLIFSQPKVGKTTLVSKLPNTLIIDTESGSKFIDGYIYDLLEEQRKTGKEPYILLKELSNKIIEANNKENKTIYDFIVIDTVTGLEYIARKLATKLYKQTLQGKSFTGTDVTMELPQGAGYMWLREAFQQLYKLFDGISKHGLILTGHFKQSSINKDGKDLSAKDIALTGKLKEIISADMDAVGFMFRNKSTNQNILSFKTNEQDLITGARPLHLRGKEFVISELTDDGTLNTYWNDIYLEVK